MIVQPTLLDQIKKSQKTDPKMEEIKSKIQQGAYTDFTLDFEGVLRIKGRVCVPNDQNLRNEIMNEAHNSGYTIHPSGTKMY